MLLLLLLLLDESITRYGIECIVIVVVWVGCMGSQGLMMILLLKVFFSSWKRSYVRPRVNPRQQRHDRRATWYGGTTIPISNEALLQAMEWNGMVWYHTTIHITCIK